MNSAASAYQLAERYRRQKNWSRADACYRELLAVDPAPQHQIAYGIFLAERQQFGAAIRHLMRGLDGVQSSGDLELQTTVFLNLAVIYRELGENQLAQSFQRQALKLQDEAGADALLDWSADALLAGKTTLAAHLAGQAFSFAEQDGNIEQQADACGLLGVIAARDGKWRRAVWHLIRAARTHRLLDDDHGLATDYQNLSEVCAAMQRWKWQTWFLAQAEVYFARAGRPISVHRVQSRRTAMRKLDRLEHIVAEWN